MKQTKVKEIFTSIQGEGPFVGYKQIFIRFCTCNLKCKYCDTDFLSDEKTPNYTAKELYSKLTAEYDLSTIHSVSLTGGEPLLQVEFLEEFLPLINSQTKIYLETNATLPQNLLKIKKNIDIISADIKLKSSTGFDTMAKHAEFFEKCDGIQTFAKVVFDENITQDEILQVANLGKKFNIEIILQPKMIEDKMSVNSEFCSDILDKFLSEYAKVRVIPQVHKFLNVR